VAGDGGLLVRAKDPVFRAAAAAAAEIAQAFRGLPPLRNQKRRLGRDLLQVCKARSVMAGQVPAHRPDQGLAALRGIAEFGAAGEIREDQLA